MPYPDDETLPDAAAGPSPFTAQSVYPADRGATNPELAKEFLATHRAEMAARAPEIDNSLSKMQLNVDSMTKMLDDTVASIKAAKSGRSNLPLMAMGAGMMSGTGNFGSQLGAGFGAMVPVIQKQRDTDESTDMNLAQLAMRKTLLQQAPLEAKLAYMKAMQVGDQSATRAIEQALIRAQSTGGNQADKQATANQKLTETLVSKATDQARKQVDGMAKSMDWDAETMEAEYQRRARANIKAAATLSGINIPDTLIDKVVGSNVSNSSKAPTTRKTFVDLPVGEDREKISKEAGLPTAPAGYIYDTVGRAQKAKTLETETANFRKESKDWDTQSKLASDNLAALDTAEQILNNKPKLTGPRSIGGIPVPNSWEYNKTPDARTLAAIFAGNQVHNVPPGQGAVSDMERKLFANMGASMDNDTETNKRIIGLQKEVFKRDRDRREFFSEYFNHYKTTDGMVPAWDRYMSSPAGTVLGRDGAGNPVANKNRLSWREYFRKERGAEGPDAPQMKAKGGPIMLGSEYD